MAVTAAAAQRPARIVSINACADQLLLALADREQIAALSRYVDDEGMSFYRGEAGTLPRIAGAAEEVLKLAPDLVVAGTFTRRETRERLAELGIRVALIPPVKTIDDVRKIILTVGDLLGGLAPDKARAAVAKIDAALADVAASARGLTVLHLQRRGFVAGAGTLVDDILARLGAHNAAQDLGVRSVRRASLEAIVKARPDVLLLFEREQVAPDQGSALLAHPALDDVVPPERRVPLAMNQVICGGPQVAVALRHLAAAFARIEPRRR